MTMGEAGRRYGIPEEILQEYERWGLCGAVKQVMGGTGMRRTGPGTAQSDHDPS